MTTPPPVGTIGVTPTYGNTLDRFVGKAIRWTTATEDAYGHWQDAKVNHAVVYVGNDTLVEAHPGGAGTAHWDAYGDNMIWLTDLTPTHPHRQLRIAASAKSCVGIGYNYLDFVAIALAQQRLGSVVSYDHAEWWVRRLASPWRLICSQLCDYAYQQAGVHLFNDNRPTGLVSPADLARIGGLS